MSTQKKYFSNEAALHRLVLDSIKADKFSSLIVDEANIESYSHEASAEMFPQFSLDHLTRRSLINAGKQVLDSLSSLEILTSDQNISSNKQERMRPDIVCINPENETIVVIEIKNEKQTGRESLTELYAYEQEIKNILPMMGNYDIKFVLISPEWSTLMDHSVASAVTWSGRDVLMLTARIDDAELKLLTRVPVAWNITGNVYFPEQAFPSVTVCLYEKDAYIEGWSKKKAELDDPDVDQRLITALNVMVREGDRLGGHGFVLLWKDTSSSTLTRYNITVCGVSPFAFYAYSRKNRPESGIGHLIAPLDRFVRENEPSGHSESLLSTAVAAYPILREIANPMLEGFSTWAIDRADLISRAEPLLCDFWGVLGKYSRDYVMNPAVRTHRRNTLVQGLGDWRDPRVGLPLIQSFTRPEIFSDGDVRCSDAFRLGVMMGLDRTLRHHLQDENDAGKQSLHCHFRWNYIEYLTAVDEVRLLADAANNVTSPSQPFKFHSDPLADDEVDYERFIQWIFDEFFQQSLLHLLFLEIGLAGCVVFDEHKRRGFDRKLPTEFYDPIKTKMIDATSFVLFKLRQLEKEGGLLEEQRAILNSLRKQLGLRTNFSENGLSKLNFEKVFAAWDLCLIASEHVIDAVYHKHTNVALANIDWIWVRQGIGEMRAQGVRDAGVILLPNGSLVTGRVLPKGMNINLQIEDLAKQVPFLDRSNGFGMMRIVTWESLESGEAFNGPTKTEARKNSDDGPDHIFI